MIWCREIGLADGSNGRLDATYWGLYHAVITLAGGAHSMLSRPEDSNPDARDP